MARRKKVPEAPEPMPSEPLFRPCDRCARREAQRFGKAQVVAGERGLVWVNVGLCDRCAARCAAPGTSASALSTEHAVTIGKGE